MCYGMGCEYEHNYLGYCIWDYKNGATPCDPDLEEDEGEEEDDNEAE